MKTIAYAVAAAILAVAGFGVSPASAQLLGGLLGGDGGGGGGGGGSLGSTVSGLLGGGSGSGGGGSGGTGSLDLDSSDGDVGVTGVATIHLSSNNSGTNANGTVLNGGGSSISIPLGGLLGGNSNAGADLPDLASLLNGGPGSPGDPGAPGAPGANGGNGFNGFGINGRNGTNGINGLNSSRLRMLMRILQDRAWLRFAQGNKLCLANFAVANAGTWIKQSEYGAFSQLVSSFAGDIKELQQMMKRCRNGQNRLVDIARVIGVQLQDNGQLVVITI